MSLLYVRRLPNSRIRWLKLVLNQLQGEAWSYRDWLTQSSLPQPYRGWWLPGPWWVSASKGKEGQACGYHSIYSHTKLTLTTE